MRSIKAIAFFAMLLASVNVAFASSSAATPPLEILRPPVRVVTLSPHLAEMVEQVGGVSLLVGVSAHSDYSKNTQSKTVVSDARSIDFERLKQLQANVILIWTGGTAAQHIQKMKTVVPYAKVYEFNPKTLSDIKDDLIKIGTILNMQDQAHQIAKSFDQELRQITKDVIKDTKVPVKVFYQVWPQPLMTINHQQMIHDVIDRCGGENIFAQEKLLVPQVTREAVLAANPDLIIGAKQSGQEVDWSNWKAFPKLSANLYQGYLSISGVHISQPTPNILRGTQQVCSAIARIRQLKSQAGTK